MRDVCPIWGDEGFGQCAWLPIHSTKNPNNTLRRLEKLMVNDLYKDICERKEIQNVKEQFFMNLFYN